MPNVRTQENDGASPGNDDTAVRAPGRSGDSPRARQAELADVAAPRDGWRRELERARARAAELDALLAQLSDAVAVFALDGRVVTANPAARRLFGMGESDTTDVADGLGDWSLDRLAREADVRAADGDHLPLAGWPISRALRGEAVRNQEMRVRMPAGETLALAASAVPLVDAEGTQWGAAVVLREVTEEFGLRERLAREREASRDRAARLADANAALELQHAQLEQQATEVEMLNVELQERNEELDARVVELDAVLDQLADGVVIVDARGEFLRLNPAVQRIYGRPLAAVPASQWADTFRIRTVTGEPIATEDLPIRRSLRERRVIEGAEWTAERPDGSRIRLLGSASPLRDKRGSVFGAVLVFRDITERTRLVEEVQKATQLKERFFAQISHELRTPINAILGYSNLIAEGIAGELPKPAQDMVDRIRRSGQHLLELVNDVLDISRLEAGKVQIEPVEFDLVELARDTMTSVEPQAQAKGLALALDAPPSLRICSDPARVRQVLLNLASNAVKFTDRGEVRICVEHRAADGRVALRVRDTGPGIAPRDRESVFAEFVQVGSRTKRQEGTGLGLPISRRLARLLGGELTLESELGAGSTFTLLLPTAGPPPPPSLPNEPAAASTTPEAAGGASPAGAAPMRASG